MNANTFGSICSQFATAEFPCADTAVELAKRFGWRVFPVGSDKRPFRGTHGFLDATDDPEQIERNFAARPHANLAIATGVASGFFAFDVDVKNGMGWTELDSFERHYGDLPETLTVATPSGGVHFYYADPDGRIVGNLTNIDGLQIDIRGEGGYVVAPPSLRSDGAQYRVLIDAPIASAPGWLIDRIEKGNRAPAISTVSTDGTLIPGGRNSGLCSIAGTLRRRGMGEEAIASALQAINETQCKPPLPASDVKNIARSVSKYPAESPHPDTDTGNARRLVDALGGNAHYDHARKAWYLFDGKRWKLDTDGAIIRAAKKVGDDLLAQARLLNDLDTQKRKIAFAIRSQSNTRIQAMISLAESEPGVPVDPNVFDQPLHLLNVANGTIDLRTGLLRPHDRSNLLSKIIDIDYHPDAPHPVFDKFVKSVFNDDAELIEFLHRVLGYAVTGETSEQIVLFMIGAGANGKSTLLKAISDTLGVYAAHTPTETLLVRNGAPSNDIARLKDIRFVTASEANSSQKLNESFVKQVTGDERLTARFLYGEWFEFKPVFKLILGTNFMPQIDGSDPALDRRIRMLPFDRVFEASEQDKDLGKKLAAESPGILAWLVAGASKWYANGLTTPAAVMHAGAEFRAESDTVGSFIEDRCELVTGEIIQASHLFRDYRHFTEHAGRTPVTQTAFGLALNRRGIPSQKRGGSAYRVGIKLNSLAA